MIDGEGEEGGGKHTTTRKWCISIAATLLHSLALETDKDIDRVTRTKGDSVVSDEKLQSPLFVPRMASPTQIAVSTSSSSFVCSKPSTIRIGATRNGVPSLTRSDSDERTRLKLH